MPAAPVARRVATVEVVPALGDRRRAAGLAGAALVAYAAATGTAAAGAATGLLASLVAVAAVEAALERRVPVAGWALTRTGLGTVARTLVRGLLLVLLAARALPDGHVTATAATVLAVAVLSAVRAGGAQVVEVLRTPAVLSRGLALDLPEVPRALPAWLRRPGGRDAVLELPAAAGLAMTAATGSAAPAAAGLAISVLLAASWVLVLALHALRLHRARARTRVAERVAERLREHAPQVLLYFGGDPSWRYQVEMWLEPVELLERPALVVVREPEVLVALAPTSLPVVCVRNGSALTALELPEARVSLFVANTGDAMHLLRRRGVTSVFVGHGDSDKAASTNPFARVYDEIWVAGQAGSERYAQAGTGVDPARVVEVGRPQLGERTPRPVPGPGEPLRVLYAPTWEGWGDDPFHSSLADVGAELVRALLERPDVVVLYRPHPLSGSRDPRARRAHAAVLELLRVAGAAGPEVAPPLAGDAARAAAGDVLDLSLRGEAGSSARQARAEREAWSTRYWAAAPDRHRVLTTPAPDLMSSFAQADVLVADVSSVTTEWLAVDRPYAVADAGGLPAGEFRARYPSSAAGLVLGPDLAGLEELLAAGRGRGDDRAAAREAARAHLLGPDLGDPVAGLRAAVDRLCGAAPLPGPAGVPR